MLKKNPWTDFAVEYCPHGFATKAPRGVPIICGYCDPKAYDKRMREKGVRKTKDGQWYAKGGASVKRVLAW